jgi:thiamine-phosphate pyrophosphorylase
VIVQLVTDRRRLAPAEGDADLLRSCLLAQGRAAVAAGIDLLQVREPDLEAGPLRALVAELVALAKGSSTRIVVNDRLDVAIAAGAAGVHLKSTSLPVARVRALVHRGFLIGCSVHDVPGACDAASHADYLVAGSVFPTISKPGSTVWLGLEGLAEIVRAVPVPVLGIGGITCGRVADVARSGAAGVAGIGLFMGESGSGADAGAGAASPPRCLAVALDETTRALRIGFDTTRHPF